MIVKEFELNIGVGEPFSFAFMSDNHLCYADMRDGERKVELCKNRLECFMSGISGRQEKINGEMFDYVRSNSLPLVHAGDLIDFVSLACLEKASDYLHGINTVMCAGNHEFSQYVGEAWEDEAYRAQSFEKVSSYLPHGFDYGVSYINGLKFITVDNGYYYIRPEHLERFRKDTADGAPFVLVLHNPVCSEDLFSKVTAGKAADEPPYLMGCTDKQLEKLSEHRFRQQRTDDTTREFIALCNSLKNLKAVLAGHLHAEYVSRLDSGAVQLVADGAFREVMYKINVK